MSRSIHGRRETLARIPAVGWAPSAISVLWNRLWDAFWNFLVDVWYRSRKPTCNGIGGVVLANSDAITCIITASNDKTARIWDAATANEIKVLRGHEAEALSAAFSPDGTRIFTASVVCFGQQRTCRDGDLVANWPGPWLSFAGIEGGALKAPSGLLQIILAKVYPP
jgi:hypothetical protein